MQYLKKLSMILLLLLAFQNARAQDFYFSSGLAGTDYKGNVFLSNTAGRDDYASEQGMGYSLGIGMTAPVLDWLSFNSSFNYRSRNAEMSVIYVIPYYLNGYLSYRQVGRKYNVGLDWLGFDISADFQTLDNLYISFGGGIGLITRHSFTEKRDLEPGMTIAELENFTGNKVKFNKSTMWTSAGLRYDLEIGNNLTLAPSILLEEGLTDIVDNGNWKVNSLTCWIAVKYRLFGSKAE